MNRQSLMRHILGYSIGFSLFVVGIPFGLYLISAKLDPYFPVHLIGMTELRIFVWLLLGSIGLMFMVWSNLLLFIVGKGGPADVFGVTVSPQTRTLVTSGPYRYTRNPMAFGSLMFYFAVAFFLNSLICLGTLTVVLVGATIYLKRVEEKRLLRDFGDAYEQYRDSVPMLIPFPQGLLRKRHLSK